MKTELIYYNAEQAAQWAERGDDFNQAEAIRKLIAEHKTMSAGGKVDRNPCGYLYQHPVKVVKGEDVEYEWSDWKFCADSQAVHASHASVRIKPIFE